MPLKFKVDIQSQSKVRVRKPKNPIWPPGGHFESDVAENRKASAYGHHQHAYENWNWNSKGNLTYAPETMSSTDRRTDGQTDGQCESSIPPHPPTSLGGGIIIPLVWVSMASLFPGKWWQWTRQVFCCSSCDSVQNCVPQVLWSPECIFLCFMLPVPMNPIWFPALMSPCTKFYITYIPL